MNCISYNLTNQNGITPTMRIKCQKPTPATLCCTVKLQHLMPRTAVIFGSATSCYTCTMSGQAMNTFIISTQKSMLEERSKVQERTQLLWTILPTLYKLGHHGFIAKKRISIWLKKKLEIVTWIERSNMQAAFPKHTTLSFLLTFFTLHLSPFRMVIVHALVFICECLCVHWANLDAQVLVPWMEGTIYHEPCYTGVTLLTFSMSSWPPNFKSMFIGMPGIASMSSLNNGMRVSGQTFIHGLPVQRWWTRKCIWFDQQALGQNSTNTVEEDMTHFNQHWKKIVT